MNLTVDKYLQLVNIEWKKTTEYKFEFFLRLCKVPVYVFLLVLVWLTIFEKSNASTIAGMNVQMFVMYIIVARLITYCSHKQWEVHELLLEYVRTGRISLLLARPVRFSLLFFLKSMTGGFFQLVIVLGILLAGNMARYAGFEYFFPNILHFLLFAISFSLAMVISFLVYYSISLLIFWFGDVWSVWGIMNGIESLFTGEIIPLTITPTLYAIASLLPFKYMVFTPVFIYLEKFSIAEALQQIGIQILWVMFFAVLAAWVLKAGLRKTDIQGG